MGSRVTFRCRKLLDLAHNMPCMAAFPHGCTAHLGVVPAHSNLQVFGRGHSHKSADCFFAALCGEAHREIDSGLWVRDQKETEWLLSYAATQQYIWQKGLVTVA